MNTETVTTDVLDVRGAAEYLRVGPKAIRRLARLKRIPHRVVDCRKTLRFSRAALEQWLRDGGAR